MTLDPAVIRGVALFVPLIMCVCISAIRAVSGHRVIAAVILATTWNVATLLVVNLVAIGADWWEFGAEGGVVAGMPMDLLLGWAALWGAVPVLAGFEQRSLWLTVGSLVCVDLALMPFAGPIVVLGEAWLVGEFLAVTVALVPGLALARWTIRTERLPARAGMQVVLSALMMIVLPFLILEARLPSSLLSWSLVLQLLAVPLLLGITAVREFVRRGAGTPLPYDPPKRLVTSGPYAYVRNPMQVSMVSTYVVVAAWTLDWRLLIGAVAAFAYCAGLADWHESQALAAAHGGVWMRYRLGVHAWLPRWRPWGETVGARLYVSQECGPCSRFGSWITARRPVALAVVPAESHPRRLQRMTYESDDGLVTVEGINAAGRMLAHINMGWALVGWAISLPGIRWFIQLWADVFFPPRTSSDHCARHVVETQ